MRISFSVGFFMIKAVTCLIGASVSIKRMEVYLLRIFFYFLNYLKPKFYNLILKGIFAAKRSGPIEFVSQS